ncbi:MAG: hypothetical protein JXN63_07150 [Candidatus Delongbacteria bacterium]|nr:hypothetical protein [Candidatus Delongbacteria bacterium]
MLTIKQHVLVNEQIEEFYENENNPQKQADIAEELSEEYPDYNTGYILKLIMLSKDDDTEKYKAVLSSITDKKTLNLSLSYPYDVLDTDQPGFSEAKAQIFTNFLKKRAEYLESDYAKSLNKNLYLKELFGIYDAFKDAENLLEITKKLITQDFNYVLIKRYFEGNGEAPHRKKMNDYYREYQKVMSEWNNTTEEKMEVFSKVYSEIKYSSASLKITAIQDWERFANSYIPKLIRAENKLKFYELLAEMVHKIGDNHNNLSFPGDIEREFCNPGLSLSFIKDKFFVRSDHVYKGVNISAGDELVKINDVDTDEYI